MTDKKDMALPAARACALRAEPASPSQAEPLVANAGSAR